MLSPQNQDEEFDFYLKFAKPLVLNLPDTNDRIKAATWIRYLKKDTTDPAQRAEYLKLLLFVLQRRKLFGPFATVPDESKPLESIPQELNIQDVAKSFIEIDKQFLKATLARGGYGEWPPYNVVCSSDMREYAACQEIPNFGVQSYFAISQDPLKYWRNPEKALFPIGESIQSTLPECPLTDNVSPDISCFVSGDPPRPPTPGSPGSPRPRISPTKGRNDAKSKGLEDVASKSPKQTSPSKQDEFEMDDRVPPSWGSNLVNVKDSPPPTSLPLSPVKELDMVVTEQDMLDFFNDDIDLDEADLDEVASYLQGDRLTSPERPQSERYPTGSCGQRTPTRSTSHATPTGSPSRPVTPAKSGSLPSSLPLSPELDILVQAQDMLDYFKDDIDLYEADMDEIASYLQGDRFSSPEKPQPTGPVYPGDSPTRPVTPPGFVSQGYGSSEYSSPSSPVTPTWSPKGFISPKRIHPTAPMTPQRTPPPRARTPPAPCRIPTPSSGSVSTRSPPDRTPSPFPKYPSTPPSTPHGSFKADSVPYPKKFPYSPPAPKPILSPDRIFNALEYIAADKDMLDYYNESINLPDDDPAFFLQGDALDSPERPARLAHPSEQLRQIEDELSKLSSPLNDEEIHKLEQEVFGDSRSPALPQVASLNEEDMHRLATDVFGEFAEKSPVKVPPPIPIPKKPSRMNYFQKRIAELEKKQLASPAAELAAEVAAEVQQVLEEINLPSTSALKKAGDIIEKAALDTSGVGLGGDSFIAPDKKDYRWMGDLPPGPGIPTDEQQDPAMWDSFGWWTDDPDEIFMYMSPSPRGKRAPADDPYAADRERWADEAVRTPPIFSKDPRIREGPAAQRKYNIDEFGMLSFEEPVWTSAEQYFKYKKEFSPYKDQRDIDRKTLDPSQFPKYESPRLQRRFSDIQGAQDEEQFFGAAPPDFADIPFSEQDYRPMSRVEAKWEAIRHGPQYIGLPPSRTPEPDEGEWADTGFLQKTPPEFMFEPPFLATPPKYTPNLEIDVDDLEDTIARHIEEDLKIINANLPVTTPQRSPSPKRLPGFVQESPPFVPEIDVEPDPYIPSPDKMPERHVVPPKKMVSWNVNIGSPLKFKRSEAVVIDSEEQLLQRNLKRKKELKLIYEQQFGSPTEGQKIPTPPPFPHLMDSYVPRRLPPAMAATKLPPPGWDYKTPPHLKYKTPPLRQYRTPTGISPPKGSPPRPADISMYNESPPSGFLSPGMAVSALMFSPSESFGADSSSFNNELGSRGFVVQQKPGQSYRIRSPPSRRDIFDMGDGYEGLDDEIDLYESPKTPVKRQKQQVIPDLTKEELDAQIAALEEELKLLETPERQPRPRREDDYTPELDRQLWMQSVKMHEPVRYKRDKKTFVCVAPAKGAIEVERWKPLSLETIMSPRHPKHPDDVLMEKINETRYRHNRELLGHMKEQHDKIKEVERNYNLRYYQNIVKQDDHYQLMRQIDYRRHKPKIDWPASPPVSPEPVPHMLDEYVPEGLPQGLILPSGWNWKTPPNLKYKIPPEREYKTPTGVSPPRRPPPQGTLFYESPPFLAQSPSISQELHLDFSSPDSFSLPTAHDGFVQVPPQIQPPHRVPTARDFQAPDILDLAEMYPLDFESFDEQLDLYQTPPGQGIPMRQPSPEMTPKERRPVPKQHDLTPEIDRKLWHESIKLHEPVKYDRKRTWVVPGPARLRDTEVEVTGLQAPPFNPILSPREMERREWLEAIKKHKPVKYDRKRIWVAPGPARVRDTLQEVTGLQAPPFDPIMSPRRPVDPEKEWQEVVKQMKFKADREVMADMADLHRPWKGRAQYDPDYFKRIQDDLRSRREQWARSQPQIPSPPSPPPSPVAPPHLLDEQLPEGLPPGLLPPSGWDWRTPPNLKFRMPYQRPYQTPTGMTPPRPKGVAMFEESPPEGFHTSLEDDSLELVSDTSTTSSFTPMVQVPPEISPPLQSVQPAGPDIFDRAMMHPADFQGLDVGKFELYESPPEFRTPSPRRLPRTQAPAMMCPTGYQGAGPVNLYESPSRSPRGLAEDFRTPDIFDMATMYPAGFEDIDASPVDLYQSPTRTPSPRQQAPVVPYQTREELDAEIAALEAELQLLNTPEQRQPRPRADDDITPELERQLWMQSVKMHDPVRYKRNKKFYVSDDPAKGLVPIVGWNPPQLETIMSPRHPVNPDEERQRIVTERKFQANREVMGDIQAYHKKMKEQSREYSPRYHQNIAQQDEEEQAKREAYWREYKPQVQFPASPELIPSPGAHPSLLDVPVPEGLPTGLIRPSGWSYQTPPNMRYKIPPPRKYRESTGFTPPRVIPRGLTMFHESPPIDLYSSPLEDSPEILPYRTPERIPQAQGYRPPDILDMAALYPSDFDDLTESPIEFYQSPTGLKTPSPRQQAAAVPDLTKEELDAQIAALEAELQLLQTPEQPHRPRGADDNTPELDRRLWLQSVKMHDPIRYRRDKRTFVCVAPAKGKVEIERYKPPKLETIMSPRHPKHPDDVRMEMINEQRYRHNRELLRHIKEQHEKIKEVKRNYNLRYYQNIVKQDDHYQLMRQIDYRRHKPKINWPKSPPPEQPPSPPPLHILDTPVPEGLPKGIIRPAGWNYQTPPHLKYKIPPVRQYKSPTAVSPVRVPAPPPPGSLFYESPPLLAESPESLAMFQGSPPEDLYISTSPPAYLSGTSEVSSPLYATPTRSPGYNISDVSPVFMDSPESPYLPAPPPRPATPPAYAFQPRRIPRRRHPLDPNILYACTPKTAVRNYQPIPEPLRFEQRRPMRLRPVTPEQPQSKYLETPIASGSKPWRKRRQKPIDRNLTSRRLVFDDDERQFEHEMMQELDSHLRAVSPNAPPLRYVLQESSPPMEDIDLEEISLLGDLEYEPEDFTLYSDPDAPQYNVRPAFEGQPDVDLMDTSPIRNVNVLPQGQRDFKWMGCGTSCPWSPQS